MAETKGVMLKAWMAFLKERYGEQSVNEATKKLKAEDQARLAMSVLDASWYPMEHHYSLARLTAKLAAKSDPNISMEIGRYQARSLYLGVYSNMLIKDPLKQMRKYDWIHDMTYRGFRKKVSEITSPTSCRVSFIYEKGERPRPGMCEGITGYWIEMLELTGAADIKHTHPNCVLRGSASCDFTFDWKFPA